MPPPPDRLTANNDFEEETFTNLDLPNADLTRKDFFRCTFRNTKLKNSQWARARLEDCLFEDCDLTGIQLAQTMAYDVQFKSCKLMGIDWSALAPNPRLEFTDCNLRYSAFIGVNLRRCTFHRCRITEATFIDTDLRETDFAGSDLAGTTFRNCQLQKADLSQARSALVEPAHNRVKDAKIPLESAVLLAVSLGMRVIGYGEDEDEPPRGRRSR